MTIHSEADNFFLESTQEYHNAAVDDASQNYNEKMVYLEPYINGDIHAYEHHHQAQYAQQLHHHYQDHSHDYPTYYNNQPSLHLSLPDVLPQFPTPAPTRGCSPHVYGGFLNPMAHHPDHMTSAQYDVRMGGYGHTASDDISPSSSSLTLNYFQPSIASNQQPQDYRSTLSALAPPVGRPEKEDDAEFVSEKQSAEDSYEEDGDSSSNHNYQPKPNPKTKRKSIDKASKPSKSGNKPGRPKKSKPPLLPNNINTIVKEEMFFHADSGGFAPIKRRSQVKIACIHCKKACKKCDEARPCLRCVRTGHAETCFDAPRKERMKGFKRGVYAKSGTRRASVDSTNIDAFGADGGDSGSDNEKTNPVDDPNYYHRYKDFTQVNPATICIPENQYAAVAAEFSPVHFQEDIPAYGNYSLLTRVEANTSDASEINENGLISSPYLESF